MTVNEIYTGAGASATMIPERDFNLSEAFGDATHNLLVTTDSEKSLEWTVGNEKRLVENIYQGCMAKIDKYNSSNVNQNHTQTLLIESNTINKIVFSQALSSTSGDKYKCTILAFGAPVFSPDAIDGKPSLLADNWLGLVNTFTPPSIDAEMKQSNLALGGTRNFGYQFKGAETVGEASIDCSLGNGSWLYYALGGMTLTHTAGNSNTLASGLTAGKAYALTSGGSEIYRVEDSTILPPFNGTSATADKLNSITITDDGADIPYAASQTLTISGSATASFTLTKRKTELSIVAETGTNYDGDYIIHYTAGNTPLKYVVWFDIDNAGASQPTVSTTSGYTTTYCEVDTIDTGDAAGTIATKIATKINTLTGVTAVADDSTVDIENSIGGFVVETSATNAVAITATTLVEGGEIDTVTITNKGSGYSTAPTITLSGGTTTATFTGVLGADAKADYKEVTADVTYTITENDTGDLPSFALEVTHEKGSVLDADYFQDANKQNLMSHIYTGCQVNTLTLNFEEGQEVTTSISAVARKAHRTDTNYVPKRKVRTPGALFNFNEDTDNNPYMYSDGTIKMYGQTLGRIKSGSVTISNSITPHRYIGNYDRTMASAHTAGQRTYEINLTMMITDRTIWDELRIQNETDSTVGLIEIEFAKSATDKIVMKFDNYLTTSIDVPFPDDKGAIEVNLTAQARTLNSCTYTGKWIILS